jgi:hypothetical protein
MTFQKGHSPFRAIRGCVDLALNGQVLALTREVS